jgi:AmmeMemoRadiSam system protein A
MVLSPHHQRILMDAARNAIRRKLKGLPPPPDDEAAAAADPVLSQRAGCFVTLHVRRTHELRGCVGRLDAAEPVLAAVRRSAASVLSDPRFTTDPVSMDELPHLEMDVSVLTPLRSAPGPLEFDLLNEGIYLTWGEGRAGCFLPQVARETGWSKEQLLARLCVEKMGLPATAWQDPRAKLFVFTTQVIGPEPFEAAAPAAR